jgi:hypothetical protein
VVTASDAERRGDEPFLDVIADGASRDPSQSREFADGVADRLSHGGFI